MDESIIKPLVDFDSDSKVPIDGAASSLHDGQASDLLGCGKMHSIPLPVQQTASFWKTKRMLLVYLLVACCVPCCIPSSKKTNCFIDDDSYLH